VTGSSTSYVNFSVRQNKAIERDRAFRALRALTSTNDDLDYVYVGLGSVWFVDFEIAHRELGIETMISIESDPVVFTRATYNKPYRTVEVIEGTSNEVLPTLLDDRPDLAERPWIVWLDYDKALDTVKVDELRYLIRRLPADSVLLVTFNAAPNRYAGPVDERREAFLELFGDAFPVEPFTTTGKYKDHALVMSALADGLNTLLHSHAGEAARPGGFVRAFDLRYQDGTPMVTAGGCLPSPERAAATSALVAAPGWQGLCPTPITTPPLTVRELQALRALMPCEPPPSRTSVQALGFDLEEDQIAAFAAHYASFPTFVQTAR